MKILVVCLLLLFLFVRYFRTRKPIQFPVVYGRQPAECGPACLAMVANYHGVKVSLDSVSKWTKMNRIEGTSARDLVVVGEKIGFSVMAVKIPFSSRSDASISDVPLPCILFWQENYFVVLYDIIGKEMHIAHPRRGLLVYQKNDFLKNWIARDQEEGIALLYELK